MAIKQVLNYLDYLGTGLVKDFNLIGLVRGQDLPQLLNAFVVFLKTAIFTQLLSSGTKKRGYGILYLAQSSSCSPQKFLGRTYSRLEKFPQVSAL